MRTFLLLGLYVVIVLVIIPFLLVCILTGMKQPLISLGKWALRLGQRILAIDVSIEGKQNIDRKASYVFMANHLSFLDGPLLFSLIPQAVRVILKKEVFRIPVVGQGMLHVGFIPVDRKRLKGGKKSIDRAIRLMKEKGYSFLIFPEGTRSRDGKIQAFKRGGFLLALRSRAFILPVSIKGSFELMPRGSFFVKKGRIGVIFHPPVSVNGYSEENIHELIERVRRIIQTGLGYAF